jgi:endonuclease III
MTITIDELKQSPLYSEELGIALRENKEREYFKWFLASLLFGGRISETIAQNTYRTFERYSLLRPRKILDAGWDFLVNPIMREGGYVRYDGRKSTQILRDCEMLLDQYNGSVTTLHNILNLLHRPFSCS